MRWQLQLWSVYGKILPKSEDEFRSKIPDMEEAWQFPCCWSAVDGCHIPIKCPPGGLESCKEYHNFKNFFSMMLMVWLIPSIDFSFFSPLIYGIKSRTRTPKNWQESGFPSWTSLDTWGCSISVATMVDEAVHECQPYTTTKILQLLVEPSQNGDRGCFWAT